MKEQRYNLNEFVGGHFEFTTPCPYGTQGKYTGEVLMVGSLACQRCIYFLGMDREECIVQCAIK